MKTLIFSDTHLTEHFDNEKYHYLRSLFQKYDRIIINGDFWDGFETTFTKFVNSPWKQLFGLMKQKKAIYLFGNHDKRDWTPHPELFSVEQHDSYVLNVGNHQLLIEHGHRLSPSFDTFYPKLSYILSAVFSSRRLQFGRTLRGWENMKMKHFAKHHLQRGQVLVCGHSHIAENNLKQKFINTGLIDFGVASYLRVSNKNFNLISETY